MNGTWMKAIKIALLAALAAGTTAAAEPAESGRSKYAVGATLGLSGLGVETTMALNESWNLRAGVAGMSADVNELKLDDVKYDVDLDAYSGSVFADLYPWKKRFRLSFGAIFSDAKADFEASPENGELRIGENVYTSDQVALLDGKTSGSGVSPYCGVGWGNPVGRDRRWTFTFDLGLFYRPTLDVTLRGETDPAAGEELEQQFRSDLVVENERLEDDLNDWRFFPVATVGFSWRF